MLYTTFISHQEILDWDLDNQCIRSALVDEAYARWLDEDKEQAQFYADCWTGTVTTRHNGYRVQIKALLVADDFYLSIPSDMVERARELVAELQGINGEISLLGLENFMDVVSLDAQTSGIMEELADEYMALLSGAGLIPPLMKTE